jgi:hypothetical protein
MRRRRWFHLVLLLVVVSGLRCDSRPVAGRPEGVAAVAEFNDLLAARGRVSFLSWDGRWVGTDCDAEFTFLPGGNVEMTSYGFAVQRYRGTYRIDGDGVVLLQLAGREPSWPPMVLERDSRSLILRPRDKPNASTLEGSGVAPRGDNWSYWPFRHVDYRPGDQAATRPSR